MPKKGIFKKEAIICIFIIYVFILKKKQMLIIFVLKDLYLNKKRHI
jgi:hypothetical protein